MPIKYYLSNSAIDRGLDSENNFRYSFGYLWHPSNTGPVWSLITQDHQIFGAGFQVIDFVDINGDPTNATMLIPQGFECPDGHIMLGEIAITMPNTSETAGSYADGSGVDIPTKNYVFEVQGSADFYDSKEQFEDDVNKFFQSGVSFYDGSFTCQEIENISGISSYNYFEEKYEDFSSAPSTSERTLPNAYLNYLYYLSNVDREASGKTPKDPPDLYEHSTLFNNIDSQLVAFRSGEFIPEDPLLPTVEVPLTLQDYYFEFASVFEDVSSVDVDKINKKNEKIVFTNIAHKNNWTYHIEDIPSNKWRYPFHSGVVFNRHNETEWTQYVDESTSSGWKDWGYLGPQVGRGLETSFISFFLSEAARSPSAYGLGSGYLTSHDFDIYYESEIYYDINVAVPHMTALLWAVNPEKYSDLDDNVVTEVPSYFSSTDKQIYLNYPGGRIQNLYSLCPEDEELFVINQDDGGSLDVLSYDSFLDDIFDLQKDKMRGFVEMFQDGDTAYTETIGV